jgi:tetratricopeptide (TPR) repeat protein
VLDPKFASAYNSRCWARVITGQQLQQALADCTESLRLRPDDSDTLDSRGFAYLKLDRPGDAIVDFSAALAINPRFASSLYGRGLAKLKRGDRAGADADIAAAKAIKAGIAEELARYGIK